MKEDNELKTELILADQSNGFIIKNMYPLYLHDIAGIHGTLPNEYGIFEEEPVRDLMEQYDIQKVWFEHPGVLFPYLLKVEGRPAGFFLLAGGKFAQPDIDYFLYETFILSPYRGQGLAYEAMQSIFSKHKGKWRFFTHATENNKRAQAFWRKTVSFITDENYATHEEEIDGMPKLIFDFEVK